jgi:hypothetical protein
MLFVRSIPVILSSLVLGAHFLRSGNLILVVLSAALPLLLLIPRLWALRTVQVVMVIGALEWVRTLATIAKIRMAYGEPATRMALILGFVALFTLASALLLRGRRVSERYV